MTEALLFLHILAGTIALAAAGFAVGSVKGGALHRRSGNVYTLAMLVTGASALVLAIVNPSVFLFAVGVFSLHLVFTGWRAAMMRDGRPRMADHAGGGIMALAGLGMIGWGVWGMISDVGAEAIIILVFGSIGLTLALSDWRDWALGPITGKARIVRHLGRMLGGTIATITAAGVVNLRFLPDLVVWLGPTVLITPLIFWWSARVMRGSVSLSGGTQTPRRSG